MGYQNKTNKELIKEISTLSQQITKLKLSEIKYKESLFRTRSLIDTLPQAVFEIDKKGNFTFANQALLKMLGFSVSDLKNSINFLQTLIPKDGKTVSSNIQKILKGKDLGVNEYLAKRKDGSTFPVALHGIPIYENGKIEGIRGIAVDISKLISIEKALLKSQQEFASLFDSSPIALAYVDGKFNIININPRFTKLFGYTLNEVRGRNIDDGIIHPPDRLEEAKRVTNKALKGNFYCETIRKKKDGTLFPVAISGSQVIINGKLQGLMALFQDITERKQNEKVQQVLYNISKAANSNISLKELYPIIHKELHKVIDATNFYISLLDEKENKLYFPYYRDEMDIFPLEGKDITGMISTYMIKNRKSLLLGSKQVKEMDLQGKIDISKTGVFSDKSHWLGVPLKVGDKVIGTMVVQSYTNPNLYNKKDLKLMEFVSVQVAIAIERKRTEEALQASQQEFSSLFNSSPEALIYIDEKSKILDINAQFTKLFGYTLKEIKGKNVDDGIIHSQKIIHEGKKLTKKALKGFVNYETIRKRKDGSEFPVFISSAPVKINNKLKGIITLYRA
jgi:PAS domain S-box-containing protein